MPFVEAKDGTRLFYNNWGTGTPVVFIHGWPVHSDMWEYQTHVLAAQGLRCIAYDRRGFGRSDQPWTGYDYDTLADDLAALIDTLDLQGASLVGFSMGGGEVARYLARHGAARIARVVFLASVTPYLVKAADNPGGVDRSTFDQMVAGLAADRAHFLAGFGKQFMGSSLLNFSISADLLQWLLMMAMQGSMKATLECVRAFSETDFRRDLAGIGVPSLVIHGDGDATVPIEVSGRATARLIPGAKLIEYQGAPHGLFYPQRDRLNQDLLAFLR